MRPQGPEAAAHAVACGLLDLLSALRAVVLRLDPDSGDLHVVAEAGDLCSPGLRLPRGAGAVGLAVQLGEPVVTCDVLADARITLAAEVRRAIERSPFRAVLALPLVTEGGTVGAITVVDGPGRRFSPWEVRLAQAFANQAAVVLWNAQRYDEALRRGREAEIVAQAARALNASLDLPTVLDLVLRGARELCRSDMAAIALRDVGTQQIRHFYSSGARGPKPSLVVEAGKGVGGLVLATGRPVRTDGYAQDARLGTAYLDHVEREGILTSLGVPIRLGNRIEGVLYAHNRAPRPFTDTDEAVLLRLAGHAAAAIRNAQLYGEAQGRIAQTETLLAVTRSLGEALDLTETMRLVARELARALGADMVGAYVPDADGRVLRALAGYHVPARLRHTLQETPFRLDDHPLLASAQRERRAVFLPAAGDVARDATSFPPGLDARFAGGSVLFAPMLVQGELVGGLFAVWWASRAAPGAEELRLAEAIASQAALFAANARAYDELERRRRSAESLAAVGQLVSQSLDPAVVQRRIAGSICALLDAAVAHVYRLEPVSRDLVAVASGGPRAPALGTWGVRLPWGTGSVGRAVTTRAPVISENFLADPRVTLTAELRAASEGWRYVSVLAVPLQVRDQIIGALAIADVEGRRFSTDDVHLAEAFAAHAAVAAQNAHLHDAAMRRRDTAEKLADASRLFGDSLQPAGIARRVVESLHALMPVRTVFLRRLDSQSGELAALAVTGQPGPAVEARRIFPAEAAIARRAIAERRAVMTEDVLADARFALSPAVRQSVERTDCRALLIVPVMLRSRVLGTLGLAHLAGRRFDPEEVAIVETFAAEAATALDRARLFAELRQALGSVTALSRRLLVVQEQERGHFARELHDEIGQYLTGLKLTLDIAAKDASEAQRDVLDDARATAGELIERVREIATELRSPVLDDLGLRHAVAMHVARFRRQTGIEVRLEAGELDGQRFAPDVEVAAYRIVQEALTNVARHSRAPEAHVWLAGRPGALEGSVVDEGVGCDPVQLDSERAVGLAGMRERAEILGGRLTLTSAAGQGTRVSFHLPAPVPGVRRPGGA